MITRKSVVVKKMEKKNGKKCEHATNVKERVFFQDAIQYQSLIQINNSEKNYGLILKSIKGYLS
jgi:hypothetical protein